MPLRARRRDIGLLAAALALGAKGTTLSAQAPPDRAAIDSFRTTITADSDSGHLLAILADARSRADSAPKSVVYRIELGWALLRTGVVADSEDLILKSADAFWTAGDREPHWPYPWYGLGVTKAELAARNVPIRFPPHQPVGASWLEAATRYFLQAAHADPAYVPASMALGEIVLNDHFGTETAEALRHLRPALDSSQRDPAPFLLLARLAFKADSYATAHAGAQAYLTRGGDSAVGLFEDARALFALRQRAPAESSYYAGAARESAAGAALYRGDITWIADSAELRDYDTITTAASRAGWLRQFWNGRDVAAGRRLGDRLEEHNRRWRYVVDNFPFFGRFKARAATRAYVSAQRDFDDRGVIYLRQGEPDKRSIGNSDATFHRDRDIPNQSWLYFRPSGNLIFHFAGADPGGWSLIGGLSELGSGQFESRMDFDPVYARLAMLTEIDAMRLHQGLELQTATDPMAALLLRKDSALTRRSIVIGTTTDAFPLRYPHALEGLIQAYGAGGADPGTSRLLVVYALPDLREVPYRTLPDSSVVYALRVRVQAADSFGHLALNTDSVRLIHAHRPLQKGQTLTGFAVLTVPPGDYRAKVMVADSADSIGGGWALSDLPAPALDGTTLTLSDPVLGREGSGLAWSREDGVIPLNPLNTFPKGSNATLSYELGGLTPGQPLTTRLTVRKFGEDSTHNLISLSFTDVAAASRTLMTKGLGLATLGNGRYLLTLAITQGTTTVERTRRVVVGR